MNKETISFKMEDYTITLHRDEEESKEMEQKRMALYVICLFNMMMKPMVEYYEEYHPKRQTKVENIIQKHILRLNRLN